MRRIKFGCIDCVKNQFTSSTRGYIATSSNGSTGRYIATSSNGSTRWRYIATSSNSSTGRYIATTSNLLKPDKTGYIWNPFFDFTRRHITTSRNLLKPDKEFTRLRIKRTPVVQEHIENYYKCNAYCSGESYNLDGIKKYFIKDSGKYSLGFLPKDAVDVLHVSHMKEAIVGDIFLFRRLGAFVCWNIPDEEVSVLNQVLREFVVGPYSQTVIDEESERLNYFITEGKTTLQGGDIHLNNTNPEEREILEKLAFSNAMALSVKLDMWELSLDKFSATLRHLPSIFKSGRSQIMSRKEVLQKIGELLTIRHEINLYSDLLLTPDFYWDREDLELLYSKTCAYLEISKRTMVMNEKLNLCSEVVEMLRSHMSDQYSHRLEWMIILLITVEVLFEIVHLVERYT